MNDKARTVQHDQKISKEPLTWMLSLQILGAFLCPLHHPSGSWCLCCDLLLLLGPHPCFLVVPLCQAALGPSTHQALGELFEGKNFGREGVAFCSDPKWLRQPTGGIEGLPERDVEPCWGAMNRSMQQASSINRWHMMLVYDSWLVWLCVVKAFLSRRRCWLVYFLICRMRCWKGEWWREQWPMLRSSWEITCRSTWRMLRRHSTLSTESTETLRRQFHRLQNLSITERLIRVERCTDWRMIIKNYKSLIDLCLHQPTFGETSSHLRIVHGTDGERRSSDLLGSETVTGRHWKLHKFGWMRCIEVTEMLKAVSRKNSRKVQYIVQYAWFRDLEALV